MLNPLFDAFTVILDYKKIIGSNIGVATKTTPSVTSHIDIATGVGSDALRIIIVSSTELLSPLLDSPTVILDHE